MSGLLVEHAKSGRSRCKACKCAIDKDSLRIGKALNVPDMEVTNWYHQECAKKGKLPNKPSAYKGFKELDKKEQAAFKAALEGEEQEVVPVAGTKRTRGGKAPAPAKKAKAVPGSNWKGYTPAEYKRFQELKEELAANSSEELKALCRKNEQKVTGTKDELIERVADGSLLGAVPKCGACGGGRLRFDPRAGKYTCPGYMEDEDFIRCNKTFGMDEVARTPWQT